MRSANRVLLTAACAALALTACENDRHRATQEPPPSTAGAQAARPTASVEAINDAPSRYYGKKVSLSGDVDEVYSDRAFELDGADWAFNDNIIVLTKTPVRVEGTPLTSNDDVVVTGTVRPFAVADIEKEIGWDIPADLENKLNKHPVLVADAVRKLNGCTAAWSASGTVEPASNVVTIIAVQTPVVLATRKVDMTRERVQAVSGKGLWVGPSRMAQIFVLPTTEPKDIKAGDWVHVTGTLQRVPKDAAKTWNLPAREEGLVDEEIVYVDAATVTAAPATQGTTPGGTQGANPARQGTTPGGAQSTQPGATPVNQGAHPVNPLR